MKRLVRMLLINWYRLEQVSINIEGHTAFIGPNASGKSSLLDAIQAVLVGGDKRWWNPNASAGEKSTRTLRDYCLGVVRDPDNPEVSLEFRPRDQAVSYLVLVFRDDNGDPVSVGLAMHARLDEAQETIDGRFIAPGLDLLLSDLIDRTDNGPTPMPWKRLREDLRRRAGEPFRVHPQVGEYQRHLCAVLSDGKRHLDPPRFLRAFKNAITFTPIRNVSDFVRSHILEERPIQVRSLQQALQNYREIQTRTREARQREDALATIDKHYQRAEQAERLAVTWRWVEQEAAFNALVAEMEPLRDALEQGDENIARLSARIQELGQQWQVADAALQEAHRRLAATNVDQQRARIKAERESAQSTLAAINKTIDEARLGLGRIYRLLDHAELLQDSVFVAALHSLLPLIAQEEGLLTTAWPMAPADVMHAVRCLRPSVDSAVSHLRERYETLVLAERDMQQLLDDLLKRINRLKRGDSDLEPSTLHLIALLKEHGIESIPLCDRVDVADEYWREAMEAFLGGHREALLVALEQVRDAISIYRREGKRLGIQGSRIINTLKTAEWRERRAPGSLAEMIRSDDAHALAYVNRRAGNVQRVESEDELVRYERAITADGMLATGGSVLRLRPVEAKLGREARANTLTNLEHQYLEGGTAHYQKQEEKQTIARLREDLLIPLVSHLKYFPDLNALTTMRSQAQNDLNRLETEEATLIDDVEYKYLRDNVNTRQSMRDALDDQQQQTSEEKNSLATDLQDIRSRLVSAEVQSTGIAEQRNEIRNTPGFDGQQAAERLEELQSEELFAEESAITWHALGEEAGQRGSTQETTVRNQRNQAREKLNDYINTWSIENRPASTPYDDHLPLATWVVRELTQLRETQLSQYVTEAENALREAEHAFRSDFVGKLQENLHLLDEQRNELNRNLKNRPFHGQYYRFIKQPESDLKQVLDWVMAWSPEQAGDVGGLFDAADDPNHPHREAITRIRNLLMEAADTEGNPKGGWDERLADYRQYYHFDVRMSDDKEGRGNPEYLSRRLGKGSGGEHQSPFYVAIGAALAAAYRIEKDEGDAYRGGMGLAVFDEAFSKLDLQNTVSALGFLGELGLQVILAAPDEKYGQIAEHVDTIINVYRDGGNVHIDAEYIKPQARRVLSADNPVLRPETI